MDRKVSPKYYDGLKYLMMSDLPSSQITPFSEWVSTDSFVTTKFTKEKLIKYEHYENWFDFHYATEKDLDQYL